MLHVGQAGSLRGGLATRLERRLAGCPLGRAQLDKLPHKQTGSSVLLVEPRHQTRQIGCGGTGRRQIFLAHQFHFAGDHRHLPRRANANLHTRASDVRNHNLNIVANQYRLALASRHHEHTDASCGIKANW